MIGTPSLRVWPMNSSAHIPDSGPAPLFVCEYCGFVRDDESRSRDQRPVWISMKAYRENNKVRLSDIPFVHIYCPDCSQRLEPKHRHALNRAHRGTVTTAIGALTRERIEQGLRTFLKTIFDHTRRS